MPTSHYNGKKEGQGDTEGRKARSDGGKEAGMWGGRKGEKEKLKTRGREKTGVECWERTQNNSNY
jgi:hypothetical protein